MTTKAVSLDIIGLAKTLKKTPAPPASKSTSIRSTVFSLGSDARIGSLQLSTPDFFLIEILKDQLKQLFVRINWKVPRFDIDSKKVIGFNIYRKRIQTLSDNKLSPNQLTKLTTNMKSNGSFSESKKGIDRVKSGMIDLSDLNPNLSQETLSSQAQRLVSSDQRRTLIPARIENFVRKFEKVAFVDYSQFIKKEQLKTVFVTDAVNVSMFYDDKSVGFGEEFEFYISSVSSNFEETFQSDTIRVLVQDNRGISAPDIFTKQIDVNSILVQVSYKSEEQIDNVFLYRREEDNDVAFTKVAEFFDVQKDTVEFLDKKTFFGKQFIYRAITENLHGVVSAPAEITVSSLTNIEKSRTNNLKKPVFNAVQQKNVATLTISPNDSRVLFYIVDRRDLSIYESFFVVPNRDTNGYGGNGWASNQLFYDRLNPQLIIFTDNTVLGDHIYQYRIIGVDRFGNKTSCSYQTIEILKKEILKPPTNLQIFILREFPMRIKVKWDDENVYDEGVVPFFEIQRRQGHNSFASFPLTENQFIVDEIYSDDFVQFSINKTEDIYSQLIPNINVVSSRAAQVSRATVIPNLTMSSGERAPIAPILIADANTRPAKITSRSSGVLDFLKENFIYFYRIKVITPLGSFSPYSKEAKVITIQPLASPVRFAVHIINPKVKPAVIQLSWQIEEDKSMPDHFVIERKVDNVNDVFRVIGKAYFQNKFFDRSVPFGKNYVYRVKAVDGLGRETVPVETRIAI